MDGGEFRPHRQVFPVRQDVDGDEIHGVIDLAIPQPVFPDIGIGHGHRDLRLHQADVGGKVGGGHFPAQQDLVADHQRGDHAGIILGETDRGRNLREVLQPVAAEPDALDDLQPDLGGECGHLIEAVLDGIGPNAIGHLGQLRHILGDLLGGNVGGLHQRRLLAAERRVGHA